MKENSMNKEETEKLKDLKAVYSGAIQSGEIGIANMIKGGIDLIEKLQKEKEELKNQEATQRKINELLVQRYSNSISVQKVKDKIKKEIKYHEKNILDIENITMLKGKTAKEEAEIEFNKYAIVVLKKMLQELLEGKK